MNARADFRLLNDAADLLHPTPAHMLTCILSAMNAEAKARGEYLPFWIEQAARKGMAQANREHDQQVIS